MKIVVIGAGIIGASVAYNLSRRRGVEVTVIERNQPGSGASSHSFAWTNAFGKEPKHYHELNRNSMEMWHRFSRSIGAEDAFNSRGELLMESTAEGATGLAAQVRKLQAWGYHARLIDHAELRDLEPDLVSDSFTAICLCELDGHVEVPQVIEACLRHSMDRGARLLTGTSVTGLRLDASNRVEAVVTSAGEIECDLVVVAGGTDTPSITAHAGIAIPHPESPGIVISTDPRPPIFSSVAVMHLPALGPDRPDVHLRQLADGTIRMGQGTQESLNRDDSQEHADDLLDRAAHYLPALRDATAIAEPVGYRPMPADGLPILGFAAKAPNLYIALMHSGVTLAPIVGELATIEILDSARIESLSFYRPERFTV